MPQPESRSASFLQCAAAVLALASSSALAVPYDRSSVTTSFSTFSDYSAGSSVNRYGTATRGEEWSVVDEFNTSFGPYDQSIISVGGDNALRLSNAVTSSRFSDQIWTASVAAAGETGAGLFNDRGSDHTAPLNPPKQNGTAVYNGFRLEFDFWSVTGTTQPGLFASVSPGPRQSGIRQSYVGLNGDHGGGLGLNFFDTGADGSFSETLLATSLDPTGVYRLGLEILFEDGLNLDGSGNDIVNVYLDGSLVHTGTSWESYYALYPTFGSDLFAVDAAMFRAGGAAAAATSNNGFAFDNVLVQAFNWGNPVPEPASLFLVGAGLAGCGALRRRRRRG